MITQIWKLLRRIGPVRRARLRLLPTGALWAKGDEAAVVDPPYAQEIYRALARRQPTTPDEFVLAALAADRLQDATRAVESLEAGFARHPSSPALAEHFLRIGAEHNLIDRMVSLVPAAMAGPAVDSLITQPLPWNTQVNLTAYCARAGLWPQANALIKAITKGCDDVIAVWRLSDVLLGLGRKDDADRIYRKLSKRRPDSPEGAIYSALSFERLGELEKAADVLEAEERKYTAATYLREHLLRISFASGQIDRLIKILGIKRSGAGAIQELFDKYPSLFEHSKAVEYCLDKGYIGLIKQKLNLNGKGPFDNHTLWNIADAMNRRGFGADAAEIRAALLARPRETELDYYYAAISAAWADNFALSMSIIEDGLRVHPTDTTLRNFYLQVCAARTEYDRYFRVMRELGQDHGAAGSIADFYRAAIEAQAIETFLVNYPALEVICPPDEFASLKNDALDYIRRADVPSEKAKLLVFYCRYLDLDDEFSSDLWAVLQKKIADGHYGAGAARQREQRAIEMLYRLTPPMIPAESGQSGREIDQFVDACRALALRPMELRAPIDDLSNNWTPWQCIFCSADIARYAEAMSALESVAIKTWPKLGSTAEHVSQGPVSGRSKRIKIGFIVHDSMPMMSGLLAGLDPKVYETVFLRPGTMGKSKAARTWIERAERTVEFSDMDVNAAIDTIAAEKLDIIVTGPSIAAIFFPMMARLAHLQIVLLEPNWTDGLSSADYYISWKAAEPERPEDFYRTKVAFLDNPPYFIERHGGREVTEEARQELRQRLFGEGADDHIYLCANTPPKVHPDMDEMFVRLVERDPKARIVFLRAEYPAIKVLKRRLFQKLGEDRRDRIVMLSTLKQEDAHRLLQSVDCCLDSFPLCGMSSSFDASMVGVPLVTLPKDIPFGKWTATIYDYIGVTGLTASTVDEYLDIALRLANDPAWRLEKGAEIKAKAERFIEDPASISGVCEFIARAWERHVAGQPPAHWMGNAWRAADAGAASMTDAASGDDRRVVGIRSGR